MNLRQVSFNLKTYRCSINTTVTRVSITTRSTRWSLSTRISLISRTSLMKHIIITDGFITYRWSWVSWQSNTASSSSSSLRSYFSLLSNGSRWSLFIIIKAIASIQNVVILGLLYLLDVQILLEIQEIPKEQAIILIVILVDHLNSQVVHQVQEDLGCHQGQDFHLLQ